MKYCLLLILACLTIDQANGCERSLIGTWKSDGARSMAYARENARLQPRTEAFLAALLGHMTMAFTNEQLHSVMPDVDVPVGGQDRHFAGFEERKPYKVLFCSESTIVWLSRKPFGKDSDATMFHFVNADTIWVYMGSTAPGLPDLNAREYFQRIP